MTTTQSPSRALPNFIASLMLLALVITLTVVMGGASAAPATAVSGKPVAPEPAAGQPPTVSGCWSLYAVQDPGSQSTFNDVAAVSQNDVWAAGHQYVVTETLPLIEHWNGSQWSIVASPHSNVAGEVLTSIEAISAHSIWAGGSDGGSPAQTVMDYWNGSQWSPVSTPDIGNIRGISAVSANDVWAVSSYNAMHWNGTLWSEVPLPSQHDDLRAVDAVSTNDVWAAGSGYSRSFLHWDGTRWNVIHFSSPDTLNWIQSIKALSPSDIWAVGTYTSQNSQLTLALHWDGTSWAVVNTPNISDEYNVLWGLAEVSTNDVWAVGETFVPPLFAMHWNGATWSLASLPLSGLGVPYLRAVAAPSSNDVWAVGAGDTGALAVHYTNPCSPPSPTPTATNTSTPTQNPYATPTPTSITLPYCWTSVPAPDTGHSWTHGSVQAVSTLSSNDVWALVTYQDAQAAYHQSAARWNGTRWSVVSTLPTSGYYDMVAISDNDIWAVGAGARSIHWNGSNWTLVPNPGQGYQIASLAAVDASSSNNVWAVGYGANNEDVEYGTVIHWDGTQWSDAFPYGGYCAAYSSVYVTSPDSVWVGGQTECTGLDQVLIYWNGTSWVDGQIPQASGSITAIGLTSLTDVWIAAPGYFLHSDGTHWSSVSSQGLTANHIDPISPNDIWATTNSGTLLHWNGNTWGMINFPDDNIADLGVVSSDNIWAVGSTLLPNDSRMLTLHYNTACIPTPAPTATATPTLVPPPCPGEHFTDVCPNEYFYPYVQALTNDGILYGYASAPPCRNALWIPCFNPNNPSTRGQISKIVSLAANFNDDVTTQTFEDVAPGSQFYTYTERMAERGIIGGYPCGGPSEPCVPPLNRPYFRTNNNVSRGQLSKMVALAFQWNDPPTSRTFEDVSPGSTFYTYTVELYNRGIISGYPCGGPGEACNPPENRPYFRPGNNVLRGQTAKIVQLARTQPSPTPTPTVTAMSTATLTAVATGTATSIPTSTPLISTDTPAPTISTTIIAKDASDSTSR